MRKMRVGESRWVVVMPWGKIYCPYYNDDECRCDQFFMFIDGN